MEAVILPVIGLLIVVTLIILFNTKKHIINQETNIYSQLLFLNLLFIIVGLYAFYVANKTNNIDIVGIIQKIYMGILVLLNYYSIKYCFSILDVDEKKLRLFKPIIVISTFVFILLIFLLPLNVIFYDNVLDGDGMAYNAALIYSLFSFLIIFYVTICLILKHNKITKIIPFLILTLLYVIGFNIRKYYPELIFEGFFFSYILLIMYFTIENPDVKLVQELEIAKNEADKANNAKTDFLSSMSHEIRTPLNAIVGFSEFIEKANDLKEAKEDAKDIVMASNNLLEIVNGILDINKIEANKMEIVNSEYALYEILDNLVKMARVRIGEKNIELKTSFSKKLPDVLYGDAGKLKQIITNILTNAIKYTEEGYIEFNCDCTVKENNCNLVISIKDTGRGIKCENIKGLFNKFERLEEDKNTNIEGTGLGLAITKKLLDMMGGKIEVESVYGKGSTFTVYLKQKIGKKKVKKEEDILENVTFDNNKILVVDDNLLNLKVIEKLLREYKVELDLVDSGYKCLEQVKKKKYDLIFLDIMMPKMNGIETLNKLKNDQDFKIPVVALTADAIDKADKKYLEEGFNDYLSKPIDSHALLKVLAKYLKYEKKVIKKKKEVLKNTDYLKKEKIDVDASLALLGDIKMYEEMLKTFLEESKKRILRLKKNKDNDLENYKIDVHAMKSDSKYLGFKKLAELSLDHEMNAKDNNQDYINQHFDELMIEFERIKKVIEKYLEDRK